MVRKIENKKKSDPDIININHSRSWARIIQTLIIAIALTVIGLIALISIKLNADQIIKLLKEFSVYFSIYLSGMGTPFIIRKSLEYLNQLLRG